MNLLVSVSDAGEAAVAVAGGADVIDAKAPATGALGAVTPAAFSEIRAAVRDERLVTAALGDACDAGSIEQLARTFAERGADLVKVGFAGVVARRAVGVLIASAARGATGIGGRTGVIAVACADATRGESIDAMSLIEVAAESGARGVLVDTADKRGPGLRALWGPDELVRWVAHAHACGLLAAVAGKLVADDLRWVSEAGADVAGVRGAACDGGRNGRVSIERVRRLSQSRVAV